MVITVYGNVLTLTMETMYFFVNTLWTTNNQLKKLRQTAEKNVWKPLKKFPEHYSNFDIISENKKN